MKTSTIKYTSCLLSLLAALQFISCKKLVEVDSPATSTNSDLVFSSDATAAAVMTGVYSKMNTGFENVNSLSIYPELSADNLVLFAINNAKYLSFYQNQLSPIPTSGPIYWNLFYSLIYNTNAVIEGAGKSTTLTKAVKDQLLGEAYFMRAFSHFYLVNLYGDVPLVLTTLYTESSSIGRTPAAQVYLQIISDLKMAESLLNANYVDAGLMKTGVDRLRPNKATASAFLARVYLYTGDNQNAEIQATKVIEQTSLYATIPLDQFFIKNSRETIWALQPVAVGENTPDGRFFTIPATGPGDLNPVYLSDRLLSKFEADDQRKTNWIGSTTASGRTYLYPAKYKIVMQNAPINEYTIVLRLAEQYLIRAEARAQRSDIGGAQADINMIRSRSGLGNTSASSKGELLVAIMQERRVELFAEWGHRWFDLKRTGAINSVMTAATAEKGGTWKSDWSLYPIPTAEIRANSNLSQNNGYQ